MVTLCFGTDCDLKQFGSVIGHGSSGLKSQHCWRTLPRDWAKSASATPDCSFYFWKGAVGR